MKNIVTAILLLLSIQSKAQTGNSINNPVVTSVDMKSEEGVWMRDNKVVLVQNGKTIIMEREEKLTDGSTVSKMGMIQRPDGSTVQMQEGDFVKKTGMFVPGPRRSEEQNKQ